MRTLTLCLAVLSFSASSAFAQECDRNEFAVRSFEQEMNAECEYKQEENGQKMWYCHVHNLNDLYFRFFRRAAAFSESCVTRSFTIRSIRSYGIGSSNGN